MFFPITKAVKGVWMMGISDHRWSAGFVATDPLCIVFFIIMASYFIVLEGLAGVTIGKRVVGIRVVASDGHRPGLYKGFLRNVLRIVDSLPVLNIVGVVLIILSKENARFGDRIAGTRVIQKECIQNSS
jgi:uncharacterized RDD family membrane protein YckC